MKHGLIGYGLGIVIVVSLVVLLLLSTDQEEGLVCNYSPRVGMDDCTYLPIQESVTLRCHEIEDYRGMYWRCPTYKR